MYLLLVGWCRLFYVMASAKIYRNASQEVFRANAQESSFSKHILYLSKLTWPGSLGNDITVRIEKWLEHMTLPRTFAIYWTYCKLNHCSHWTLFVRWYPFSCRSIVRMVISPITWAPAASRGCSRSPSWRTGMPMPDLEPWVSRPVPLNHSTHGAATSTRSP